MIIQIQVVDVTQSWLAQLILSKEGKLGFHSVGAERQIDGPASEPLALRVTHAAVCHKSWFMGGVYSNAQQKVQHKMQKKKESM